MFAKDSLGSTGRTAKTIQTNGEHREFGDLNEISPEDSERYVREFLDGRPDAVRTVSNWVRSVIMHKAWGFQDSEDVVQAALLALVQNLREGKFVAGNLRAYARRIAKNMCITNYRRICARGRDSPIEDSVPLSTNRHSGDETQRLALLNRILERLDEGCRQIVLLAYVQGYSRKEISEVLGVTEEAVRVRLHRCIRSARALVNGPGGLDARHA